MPQFASLRVRLCVVADLPMTPAQGQSTCPKCSTPGSPGAKFCRSCGESLTGTAPGAVASPAHRESQPQPPVPPPVPRTQQESRLAAPPTPVPPRPGDRPAISSRTIAIGGFIALLLAGGAAAAVLLGKGKASDGPAHSLLVARVAETQASTQSQLALIPAASVEATLKAYSEAYSAESTRQLAALLAPTLIRKNGNHAPEDKSKALATYAGQFQRLSHPAYQLSDVKITPQAGGALATANYTITSQNGAVHGAITFHLVSEGSQLKIVEITISPAP